MTLENLLRIGRIKEHPPDAAEIQKLLAAARRSLKDARVQEISLELRFEAAYNAIMQAALVALMANGYRPDTNQPGHHMTVLQLLPKTMGLPGWPLPMVSSSEIVASSCGFLPNRVQAFSTACWPAWRTEKFPRKRVMLNRNADATRRCCVSGPRLDPALPPRSQPRRVVRQARQRPGSRSPPAPGRTPGPSGAPRQAWTMSGREAP